MGQVMMDQEMIEHQMDLIEKRCNTLQAEIAATNSKLTLISKRLEKHFNTFDAHKEPIKKPEW